MRMLKTPSSQAQFSIVPKEVNPEGRKVNCRVGTIHVKDADQDELDFTRRSLMKKLTDKQFNFLLVELVVVILIVIVIEHA